MGLLIAAVLIAQAQAESRRPNLDPSDPKFAVKRSQLNSKFRRMIDGARTITVQMNLRQEGNSNIGKGVLSISRPNRIYFHVDWGRENYTFTLYDGKATEVDLGARTYDEYAVPGLTGPAANGSSWGSFFPGIFVTEGIVLPPDCFDEQGHLRQYAIGSDANGQLRKNVISFTDYTFNTPIPDSRFMPSIPAGLTIFQIPQPAPPIQIGSTLPNIRLVASDGKSSDLLQAIGGKSAVIAYLDPNCGPSVAALATLRKIKNTRVVVLNANTKGAGLQTGSLPSYHNPQGSIGNAFRVPMTPLVYLVDPKGEVKHVWYGFDRSHPGKFTSQLAEAISGQ